MTLAELRKLREEKQKAMEKRASDNKAIQIIVGMGTCGIAAGAKQTLDAFLDGLDKRHITDVSVTQTGCMGLCHVEPTVEVIVPGMPDTIYGKVDKAVAEQIIEDHIINKKLVSGHIYDRPSGDILKK